MTWSNLDIMHWEFEQLNPLLMATFRRDGLPAPVREELRMLFLKVHPWAFPCHNLTTDKGS